MSTHLAARASPSPSSTYSGKATLRFRHSAIAPSSVQSGYSITEGAIASVSVIRILDGQTTYVTFFYGGPFMQGVHAAGLLITDTFWKLSLVEVEEGLADGWISLDALAEVGKPAERLAITLPDSRRSSASEQSTGSGDSSGSVGSEVSECATEKGGEKASRK